MLIQGSFNGEHIVREFIEREYAFSCIWEDKRELRIAHCKGEWFLWKKGKNGNTDYFIYSDAPKANFITNDLLAGILSEKEKIACKKEGDSRTIPGWILKEVLRYWVGNLSEIVEIDCLQQGRNAMVESDGSFRFFPEVTNWTK